MCELTDLELAALAASRQPPDPVLQGTTARTEQPWCHEWRPELQRWQLHLADMDGEALYCRQGYCNRCGVKLDLDGTEQRMVPAVAIEEVRATRFVAMLLALFDGQWFGVSDRRVLREAGLIDSYDANQDNTSTPTDDARTILAALQQSARCEEAEAEVVRLREQIAWAVANGREADAALTKRCEEATP